MQVRARSMASGPLPVFYPPKQKRKRESECDDATITTEATCDAVAVVASLEVAVDAEGEKAEATIALKPAPTAVAVSGAPSAAAPVDASNSASTPKASGTSGKAKEAGAL